MTENMQPFTSSSSKSSHPFLPACVFTHNVLTELNSFSYVLSFFNDNTTIP